MKKYYAQPEFEVRNYVLPPNDVVTTSDPNAGDNNNGDLNDGSEGGDLL